MNGEKRGLFLLLFAHNKAYINLHKCDCHCRMVWYFSAHMDGRMKGYKGTCLLVSANLCFRHWFAAWFITCYCYRCTIKRKVLVIKAHGVRWTCCMFDEGNTIMLTMSTDKTWTAYTTDIQEERALISHSVTYPQILVH